MSYASSTKSFPGLLKTLPLKLSQPTGIAVIASVGIHALLGVSLPYLPISSKAKPKPIRNVQLLELNQNDLSRLPPSPLQTQPLPASIDRQIQPLSPLPSSLTSPLPPLASKDKDSSLDNLPPISPLPPLGGLSFPKKLTRSPDLNKLGISDSPLRTDLKTKPTKTLTPPKGVSELTPPKGVPGLTSPKRVPELEPEKLANAQPSIKSPKNSRELGDLIAGAGLSPATSPPPLPGSTFNSNPTPDLLAPPNPTSLGAAIPEPPSMFPPETLPSQPIGSPAQTNTTAFAPSQGNLTDNSRDRNSQELLTRIRDSVGSRPQTIKIARSYPQNARSASVPNTGFVVVTAKVDGSGKIISDSLKVEGTSFVDGTLDEEALSTVRGHQFTATGQEQAYVIQVQFKNDSRTLESVPASPNPSERPDAAKPQTSTEPQSSVKPQTSTEPQNSVKPLTSTERQNLPSPPRVPKLESSTQRQSSSRLPNLPNPENSTDRTIPSLPSLPNPENSTQRQSSSRLPNLPKPENSTQRQNSAELQNAAKPDNSTDTSARVFVEKLRRNLAENPRSNSSEKPRSRSSETSSPSSSEKPRSNSSETPRSRSSETLSPSSNETPRSRSSETLSPSSGEKPRSRSSETLSPSSSETPRSRSSETLSPSSSETPRSDSSKTPSPSSNQTPPSN